MSAADHAEGLASCLARYLGGWHVLGTVDGPLWCAPCTDAEPALTDAEAAAFAYTLAAFSDTDDG